jgi:hypothetical protein
MLAPEDNVRWPTAQCYGDYRFTVEYAFLLKFWGEI